MESFGTCCPQWYKRYSYESLIIITNNWIPNFRRMPSLQHLYMMRKDSLHLDMSTFQNFVITFIQRWFVIQCNFITQQFILNLRSMLYNWTLLTQNTPRISTFIWQIGSLQHENFGIELICWACSSIIVPKIW